MHRITFEFRPADGPAETRDVAVRDLIIAGWTGRDPRKVQEHVEELRALGVAPPETIPCFYRAGAALLTTAAEVDCLGEDSSGEAEFVLLRPDDGWWVGAGSDHTDRRVEAYSITVSKQTCPKPVAPALWRLDDVAPHWDRLEVASWVEEGGAEAPYQQGTVAEVLHPRDLIARYEAAHGPLASGTVMFGGTLPVIGGIRPRRGFALALHDPVLGRRIAHRYAARWLPAG